MASYGYSADSLPRAPRSGETRSRSSSVRPSKRQQPAVPPRSDSLYHSEDHSPATPTHDQNHASGGDLEFRSLSISHGLDRLGPNTSLGLRPLYSPQLTPTEPCPPQSHSDVRGYSPTVLPQIDGSGYALVQTKCNSSPMATVAGGQGMHGSVRHHGSSSSADLQLGRPRPPLQGTRASQSGGSLGSLSSSSQPLETLLSRITLPAAFKVTNGYHGYFDEDSISDGDYFIAETAIDMKTVIAEDGEGKKAIIPTSSELLFTPIRAEEDIAAYRNVHCEKVGDLISLQTLPLAAKAMKGNASDQQKQAFSSEEVVFPQSVTKTKGLRGKKVLVALAEDGRELELPSDTVGSFLVNPLEAGVAIGNLMTYLQGKLPHKVLVTEKSKGLQKVLTLTSTGREVTFVMRPLTQSSPDGLLLFDVPCNWPIEVELAQGQQELMASQKTFHIHNIKKRLVHCDDETGDSSLQSVLYRNVTYGKGEYSLGTSVPRSTGKPVGKAGRRSNQPLPELPPSNTPAPDAPPHTSSSHLGTTASQHGSRTYANFRQKHKDYAEMNVGKREELISGGHPGQSATLPRNLPSRRAPASGNTGGGPSSAGLVGPPDISSPQSGPGQPVVLPVGGSSSSSSRLMIASTAGNLEGYVDMTRVPGPPSSADAVYEPVKGSTGGNKSTGPSDGPENSAKAQQTQITAYPKTSSKSVSPGRAASSITGDPYIRALQGENQKLEHTTRVLTNRVRELEAENSSLTSRLQVAEAKGSSQSQSGTGTGSALATVSPALPTPDPPEQWIEEETLNQKNLAYMYGLDDERVVDLLMAMNLREHVAAFRKEGIDGLLLSELTEDDLKGLGVTSSLHIKKFRMLLDGRTSAYQKLSRMWERK